MSLKTLVIFIIITSLLAGTVLAGERLFVAGADRFYQQGEYFEIYTNLKVFDKSADNVRITVTIPALDLRRSESFSDVRKDDSVSMVYGFRIPCSAPKGDHEVFISASGDEFRKFDYRILTVGNLKYYCS